MHDGRLAQLAAVLGTLPRRTESSWSPAPVTESGVAAVAQAGRSYAATAVDDRIDDLER